MLADEATELCEELDRILDDAPGSGDAALERIREITHRFESPSAIWLLVEKARKAAAVMEPWTIPDGWKLYGPTPELLRRFARHYVRELLLAAQISCGQFSRPASRSRRRAPRARVLRLGSPA
ncbi:hypothetical protein [Solimonas sp. SE-A11]|uniref:hypothetical protein n=1 Tax=Solimonas sp. SE-A11 TaxID=3054954 RepID=UPI00259D2AAF|nr:hypothetical protein [Solimonas sp. SE-A11]MDM4772720.1 hypothetical protein [Solimonas sp. SE-A11]